ncbi:MAG: HAD family hydrolase [Eubacteriales bacterium]|nr:HAD family hydrolase [Eubacteriales bacterium]
MNPIQENRYATIYFDFDGTLQDTLAVDLMVINAVYDEVRARYGCPVTPVDEATLRRWLGHRPADFWHEFLPGVPEAVKQEANERIGERMRTAIAAGNFLFPGAETILQTLWERGIHIVILSNCYRAYADAVTARYDLTRFIDDFLCAEDYDWMPKHRILAADLPRRTGPFLMVGDRFGDMEAGHKNGVDTAFCTYGTGAPSEGAGAKYLLGDIGSLLHCTVK